MKTVINLRPGKRPENRVFGLQSSPGWRGLLAAALVLSGGCGIAAAHEHVDGTPDKDERGDDQQGNFNSQNGQQDENNSNATNKGSGNSGITKPGKAAKSTYRTDRIIVKPATGVTASQLQSFQASRGHRTIRVFTKSANLWVVQLPKGSNIPNEIAAYLKSGLVSYAEPDYQVHTLLEPNDFRYQDGSLWGLHNTGIYGGTIGADIDARDAWNLQTDASNIIVGVVDTGVRMTHEDLAANLWINPGETGTDAQGHDKATNGIDDDGDGYIDDVHGINAILGTGDPTDDHGHGTHMSGTIGAVGNNGVGVVGVCWKVQLMACKFIDASGNGSISDAITCLEYARQKGAKIINASWGGYSFTSVALRDEINALRDAGIIFVAAAGNDNNDNDAKSLFPASYGYDNVISVAATDRTDNRAFFSNFGGTTVKLGAPGYNIFSSWNGSDSDYRYDDGTSQAAAVVTGACALVWSHYPNLNYHQVIARILASVDPLPSLQGKTVTGGRLNLYKAIQPQTDPTAPPLTVWVDDSLPAGAVPNPVGSGSSWSVEPWTWVSGSPTPYSGTEAHQSALMSGVHIHYFQDATSTLAVFPGDTLFAYVYLDPVNPPREIMLSWDDGDWEHRAFWGQNVIDWGVYGTSNRVDMGPLPPAGQWVRLAVPASKVGLEATTLNGMNFMEVDGRATWDYAGRSTSPTP